MSRFQSIRKWLYSGVALLTILALAGCAGGAATKAPSAANTTVVVQQGTLTNSISATGSVRPAQTATINWQTSGKVGQVAVQLGQTVKANDVLASLDPNTLSQSTIQAQINLINAQQALANLQQPQPLQIAQAEANLATAQTNLNDLLNPTALVIANAQAAVVTAQTNLTTAQNDYDSLNGGKGSDQAIQTARINILTAQKQVDKLQTAYDNMVNLADSDPRKMNALTNLIAAKNTLESAQSVLNWYLGGPTPAEVTQATTNLEVAKAALADAQTKLDQLKNPTQSDIDLAKAQVTNAQTALDTAKAGPTASDLTVAQSQVTLAQLAVNASQLTAPFDGTITSVRVLPGDLVSNGTVAFQIDDTSKMLVDLKVSEIDIHQVQVSQPVTVTFNAIPNKSYSGQVSQIGLVGTSSQGSVSFDVTVQITNVDNSIKSGMSVVASITVAEAKNVLEIPSQAIRTQGTNKFVTVVNNGIEQNVDVTVGLVSDTMSQVSSPNLKAGDHVLVVSQAANTSKGKAGFDGNPVPGR